jgi:hypothetical protein
MKKWMIIPLAVIGCALMLGATATAAKPDETKDARKLAKSQCKAEKRADKAAFRALYGKRAMRSCVKGEKSDVKAEVRNASQACKAERAEDPDAFKAAYGSNKNGKNALGRCVSRRVKRTMGEELGSFKNAAKGCKAERAEDPDAFKAAYGSNKNGKNALGKCVSSAQKQTGEEPPVGD